jgi:phosphoribosylaminoimidazolecarboxamide formyltransferase/IMP cyclohydrolase
VELVSTGGTARFLREAGLKVRDVAELTGFPELLGGRVKTLHPRVHGGILAIRDDPDQQRQAREYGIEYIDMVIVNLYPFQEVTSRDAVKLQEAIENIDIGGPAMLRSAAKNFHDVAVVVDPADYSAIADEMDLSGGALSLETRLKLARKAFEATARYDAAIAEFFEEIVADDGSLRVGRPSGLPTALFLFAKKAEDLRYGENPHQRAALYLMDGAGLAKSEKLQGKELSYNNLIDLESAWSLVLEFAELTCAIIKHTNPCGVATGSDAEEAFHKALATDPVSAFGGIIGFNDRVNEAAARAIVKTFFEAVIAPDYDPGALEVFSSKKNLRVIRAADRGQSARFELRTISGGLLLQDPDRETLDEAQLRVVTERRPTPEEIQALIFAWKVVKHVKSNAVVYARPGQLVGVGAGQMSRVDSVRIAAMKALLPLEGTVLASDAFFPFRDGIDEAARAGATAIIQPGGSVRDQEVIAAANEHNLAMVFTGMRHFKH